MVAVGSPLLIEKLGQPEDSTDLTRYPLLHDAHNLWPQFHDLMFPQGTSGPTKNIRVNQTTLAIEAAIAVQGLALASLFFLENNLAAGRLVRLFRTELRVESDFYFDSPRKPRHPAFVAAVNSWLAAAAQRSACATALPDSEMLTCNVVESTLAEVPEQGKLPHSDRSINASP